MSPARFVEIVRAHWGIEHGLHGVLDLTMNEDSLRNRLDNGPANLAVPRHMALNIVTKDASPMSKRRKLKRAGLKDDLLRKLLTPI